jgi:hypothetical protein
MALQVCVFVLKVSPCLRSSLGIREDVGQLCAQKNVRVCVGGTKVRVSALWRANCDYQTHPNSSASNLNRALHRAQYPV